MTNLAEALVAKINEMNAVIIPGYVEIIPLAPMARITVQIMRVLTEEAVAALCSGDVQRMIRAYGGIKDYKP